jgi:hypothetical protein
MPSLPPFEVQIPITTLISKLAQSMSSSLEVCLDEQIVTSMCATVLLIMTGDAEQCRLLTIGRCFWQSFRLVAGSSRTGEKIWQTSGYRSVITLELQLTWSGRGASLPVDITLGLICIEREIYSFFLDAIYIHYGTCKILNIRAEIKVFGYS